MKYNKKTSKGGDKPTTKFSPLLGIVYTTTLLMNTVTLVFVFTEEVQRLHKVVFGRFISGS